MIESYKAITGRYLKAKKKRTILTLIGIILSVALICSIGLFIDAIQRGETDYLKKVYGSYHVVFTKVDDSLISKITNNPKVSRYGLYKEGEKVKIDDKASYSIVTSTDKALELTPYRASKGRLPQNTSEAAVEAWILPHIDKNAQLGDKIEIENKQYTLVGILEDNVGTQSHNEGLVLTKSNQMDKDNSCLVVEISSKVNLKKALKEIESLADKKNVMENSYVISMEGGADNDSMKGIYISMVVIIGIVLIATIAVIYNSFQISVVERFKQFGLLRAVGTTPKQIRSIVLREATILASIGVPMGLIFGVIAMWAITMVMKLLGGNELSIVGVFQISPMILALSALVGIMSVYISALIPAIHAGKISPLTAINSRSMIKKEKIKARKNIIVQKIFGFEGAMAAKNIRRNRKRYRITVFSIVISVVLFITFKYFTESALNINGNANFSRNVHFSLSKNDAAENSNIESNIIDNIASLSTVKKVYKVYAPISVTAAIDKKSELTQVNNIRLSVDKKDSSLAKDSDKIYKNISYKGENKTQINSSVAIYTKEALEEAKKYVTSGSIDTDNLNKENGVIVIAKNIIYNNKVKKSYMGPVADIKVGDEILLQKDIDGKTEFGSGDVKSVKVMAVVNDEPFDFNGSGNGIKMITTEEVAKKLTGKGALNVEGLDVVIKNVNDDKTAITQIDNAIKSDSSINVINYIDANRQTKSGILMIEFLLYGFVVVISLIGSVNIINTLTTNIILRRREFATLKSIGLTQRGLRKMIVLEGLLYGIMGTIYGGIVGSSLCYLIFKALGNIKELRWSIPWNGILISGVCALALGYLSVISPLMRIKKDNLIDTIREE